ncbi:hypothetical protein LINPERPRIM_LOCUS31960 [Linum perenne]
MEFFTKTKAIKLRSHLDKYLLADDDGYTVRQTRTSASSPPATWFVELIDGRNDVVRLRSSFGTYLTASDAPFLLGAAGYKAVQTSTTGGSPAASDRRQEWRPMRDGFQVRLRSRCGKYLRGWRNSVTHDDGPHGGAGRRWMLWDVEAVVAGDGEAVARLLSPVSYCNLVEDATDDYKRPSLSNSSSVILCFSSVSPIPMDIFNKAKAVRLRSHHEKYLLADDDEESVIQDKNGSSKSAKWVVEPVPGSDSSVRLKSIYGKYLTASNHPFLLGMTGRKVLQTLPRRLDSSVEWEPVREGYGSARIKLRTKYGNFLRANGRLPPWRNSITHDIPHRSSTQDWVVWDVDVVEIRESEKSTPPPPSAKAAAQLDHVDSLDFEETGSPYSVSDRPAITFERLESTDSNVGSPPKTEGRTIYYHMADESGDVDDDVEEGYSMTFKGNGVEELTEKLKEETGLGEIVVCSRSPLNGKLYPLRLQLPPNNADMHVIVIPSSSKVARGF